MLKTITITNYNLLKSKIFDYITLYNHSILDLFFHPFARQ